MDDQTEKPVPEATHVWIRIKQGPGVLDDDRKWVRTAVVHPLACGHEQTICLECAHSWSNGHEIRYEMPDEVAVVVLVAGPDGKPIGLLIGTQRSSKRQS